MKTRQTKVINLKVGDYFIFTLDNWEVIARLEKWDKTWIHHHLIARITWLKKNMDELGNYNGDMEQERMILINEDLNQLITQVII